MEPLSGTLLREEFRLLLDDADGYVRESAIKRVASEALPGATMILTEAAGRPRPGWMCLSCRTVNLPPGPTSCSKDGCLRVGADPAKVATELLNSADGQSSPEPDDRYTVLSAGRGGAAHPRRESGR